VNDDGRRARREATERLAKAIGEELDKRGWSTAKLARRAGVSNSQARKLINLTSRGDGSTFTASDPSFWTVVALARALRLDLNELAAYRPAGASEAMNALIERWGNRRDAIRRELARLREPAGSPRILAELESPPEGSNPVMYWRGALAVVDEYLSNLDAFD